MVVRVALKMLGLAVFGCVVVVAVVFMWGLLAFIVGMIGGRALLWIWDLIVADASHLEIWFMIGVGVLFLVGALTFWVIGEVGYLGYRIERFRRALYLLCWDWVEACYVEPAEPTVSPRPAWVPSGPIEVLEPVTRSLTFPTHRSYGVVYHRPARDYWGGRDEWWPGAWERFLAKFSNGEPAFPPAARGTMSVPTGGQLRLWSSQKDDDGKHLPAELDVLRTFAPDAFDSLAVLWPSDGEQLAHIAHLTELRELVVLSRFGDAGLTDLGSLESLLSLDLAYNKTLSDDGVATLLARNPRLAYIYLSGTGITDASLRLIAPKTITILRLDSTAVTDEGLATLSEQTTLARLSLRKTAITDAALRDIRASWPSLEILELEGTGITDSGLAAVDAASRLRWLDVSETSISAETLDAGTFGRVETLNVSNTALSDTGLRRIAALPRLRRLSLWDTAVTDAGLEALHGHPTLAALSLSGDEFTTRGLLALLESLPAIWEVNYGMHRAVSVERVEMLKDELRSGVVEGSW